MIPQGAEVQATFEPNPDELTAVGGYRQNALPPCVRGLAIRNDGPAVLELRIGTGTGGSGGLSRRVYPYTWATLGAAVARFALTLADPSQSPPAAGSVQIVLTDLPLAWAEGQLRGAEGLTLRDSHSGAYAAAANIVLDAPSGEVMLWNDDSTNDLLVAFPSLSAGVSALHIKPGAAVQLGIAVSAIDLSGSAAYRLEVWR